MTISLAAIEAADKAATPGPWRSEQHVDFPYEPGYLTYRAPADGGQFGSGGDIGWQAAKDDGQLIALYRNETPKLVQALRNIEKLADDYDNGTYWAFAKMIRQAITDAGVQP